MAISLFFVCILFMAVMFMQFKTIDETDITAIENMRETELREAISTWKAKYEELEQRLTQVNTQISEYNESIETDKEASEVLDKELDSKYEELLDKISEETEVGNGTTEINNDFNNLLKTGKFLVHTVKGTTKNAPIDVTGDWWVDVFVYGSGTSKKVLQEAVLHGTSSSSATSGPANRLVRCCTNTTWSSWQYSYSQFAG